MSVSDIFLKAKFLTEQTIKSLKRTNSNRTVIIKTKSNLEIEIWIESFYDDPRLEIEIKDENGELLWES